MSNISSQTSDLKQRIIYTVLILCIYRLGTFIPLPGIDPVTLQSVMDTNQKGLLGMFNVFAGGAVNRMAIFALGIMPYISSSIIISFTIPKETISLLNPGYFTFSNIFFISV